MPRLLALVLLAAVVTHSASAAEPVRNYSVVLLPVVITNPIPGAFGSRWVTEIVARNTSGSEVRHIIRCPGGLGCLEEVIPPHTTFTPDIEHSPSGALFVMWAPAGDDVLFNLRVRDLSRKLDTWGTEIPTVRVDEALVGPSQMLDVPYSERFRLTLRIYDLSALPGSGTFSVRVYKNDDDSLLNTLTGKAIPADGSGFGFVMFPELLPATTDSETRVRIAVEPPDSETAYWAFVSVTNNATQHITVSAPKVPFKAAPPN